jgi:hypothetical protein
MRGCHIPLALALLIYNKQHYSITSLPHSSYSQIKSKVVNFLVKVTVLRINLNIDDAPRVSPTLTHPSYSPIQFPLFGYALPPLHLVFVRL